MALRKFDLSSLVDLDGGRIREAVEQAVRRCQVDCADRPGVSRARKVLLEIHLVPVTDDGECTGVNVQFQVKDTAPKRESKVYNMALTPGGLVVNDLSPEDARQVTMDDLGPQRRVEGGVS